MIIDFCLYVLDKCIAIQVVSVLGLVGVLDYPYRFKAFVDQKEVENNHLFFFCSFFSLKKNVNSFNGREQKA